MTKPLSLNHRIHYRVKALRTAEIREATRDLIALFDIPPMERVLTTLFYSPRTNGRRDPINLIPMLKACEDALVDSGVVPDDNPTFVRTLMPEVLPKFADGGPTGRLWFVVQEG